MAGGPPARAVLAAKASTSKAPLPLPFLTPLVCGILRPTRTLELVCTHSGKNHYSESKQCEEALTWWPVVVMAKAGLGGGQQTGIASCDADLLSTCRRTSYPCKFSFALYLLIRTHLYPWSLVLMLPSATLHALRSSALIVPRP